VREAVAIAVVLATTLSGLSTERALAAEARPRRAALPASLDPAEIVFSFGDDLEAVAYDLGDRRVAACRRVVAHTARFESALRTVNESEDVVSDLRAAAEPTIELCFDPWSTDEHAAARATEGFADFHERAFDFASALK
jgi:hypothetical protein